MLPSNAVPTQVHVAPRTQDGVLAPDCDRCSQPAVLLVGRHLTGRLPVYVCAEHYERHWERRERRWLTHAR